MSILNTDSSGGVLVESYLTPQEQYMALIKKTHATIQGRSVNLLPLFGTHVDRLLIIGALASSALALSAIAALFVAPVGALLGLETVVIGSALGGMTLGIYCFYNLIARGVKKATGSDALGPRRVKTNPTLWDSQRDKIAAIAGIAIFAISLFSVVACFSSPLSMVAIPMHVLTAVMGSAVGVLLARRTIKAMGQLRIETKNINQKITEIKPKAKLCQEQAARFDQSMKEIIQEQHRLYTNRLIDENQIHDALFFIELCRHHGQDNDTIKAMSDKDLIHIYLQQGKENFFSSEKQKYFTNWLKGKQKEENYATQMDNMVDALHAQVIVELTQYHQVGLEHYAEKAQVYNDLQVAWEARSYSDLTSVQKKAKEVANQAPPSFPTLLNKKSTPLSPKLVYEKLERLLERENELSGEEELRANIVKLDRHAEVDHLDCLQGQLNRHIYNLYELVQIAGLVERNSNDAEGVEAFQAAVNNLVEFDIALNEYIENKLHLALEGTQDNLDVAEITEEEVNLRLIQDNLKLLAKPITEYAQGAQNFLKTNIAEV